MSTELNRFHRSILNRSRRLLNSHWKNKQSESPEFMHLFLNLANEFQSTPDSFYSRKIILRSLLDLLVIISKGVNDEKVYKLLVKDDEYRTERSPHEQECFLNATCASSILSESIEKAYGDINTYRKNRIKQIDNDFSEVKKQRNKLNQNKSKKYFNLVDDANVTFTRLSSYVHCIPESLQSDYFASFDMVLTYDKIIWRFLEIIETNTPNLKEKWISRDDIIDKSCLIVGNALKRRTSAMLRRARKLHMSK